MMETNRTTNSFLSQLKILQTKITAVLASPVHALALFRIFFGVLMCSSLIRFVAKGWVYDFYIKPEYYFTYYGFEWIKPFSPFGMYAAFAILIVASLFIVLGFCYRFSIITFFIGFTYIELIDKSNYLNHYYFISLLSFLLIFLPVTDVWAVDKRLKFKSPFFLLNNHNLALFLLKLQIGSVYFFGGISKIKADWLLEAQPLKIWFAASNSMPVIGSVMNDAWLAYTASWGAMVFDTTIPFFLFFRKTRIYAFGVVLFFHVMTHLLFYIGMFPWIMTTAVLIFFFENKKGIIAEISTLFKPKYYLIIGLFLLQLIMPFRYLLYPGNVLWHEQGYRFSWNIMLIEKNASLEYIVRDNNKGTETIVSPCKYLTVIQQRMLSTQPDMIVDFAHFLAKKANEQGFENVSVFAECYASLNGKSSRLLIDPKTDLLKVEDDFKNKLWITSDKTES